MKKHLLFVTITAGLALQFSPWAMQPQFGVFGASDTSAIHQTVSTPLANMGNPPNFTPEPPPNFTPTLPPGLVNPGPPPATIPPPPPNWSGLRGILATHFRGRG